jgi:hypothetical protein
MSKREDKIIPELPDEMERRAAELWRKENPDMSVFACTSEIMSQYRRRILEGDAT